MQMMTRAFGEIEIDESKVIEFPGGIIGFPDLQHFVLLYDEEQGSNTVKWLQSVEEPGFAMPVLNPLIVKEDYNPSVDDELLKPLGEMNDEDMIVLVTMTIPHEIEKMTVNLRGPVIVNSATCKGCQIIIESDEYKVKYPIYDKLAAAKKAKEG
ncbi:flagellar assembly factor FliW [Lachnospiraceae bacterium XBB2008]|nr:flagellar assembly protein FliW [Lachnospiraceae bacterium]MCR5510382.1 flagellar assembly protein FliW [Lachnospiraceae bacterium]SCY06039.1 flagellar assembly factor FliW [Lachnospiraceae bacterium XBB2008]